MKNHLLIIDPQNSFCDPEGELSVPGADADMKRLAAFIQNHETRIHRISVTLDSHNKVHIAHPVWWVDGDGASPAPFTRMTSADVEAGKWRAADPEDREWSLQYLKTVGEQTIWPYHCLIGTPGHDVYPPLLTVLNEWREKYHHAEYIMKALSRYSENFSAVRPAVEVPDNPHTRVNISLINDLAKAETVWVAGEASSHCVADTVTDLVTFGESAGLAKKIILLADAMSPVPGFEAAAEDFFERMRKAGVRISGTDRVESVFQSKASPEKR